MNRMYLSRLVHLAVFVGLALVLGCGKDNPMSSVSGKVTVDGKPLSGGSVSFIPDVPPGEEGIKEASKAATSGLSAGSIGSDGTYKIYTAGKEGAPLGKYKVTVSPRMAPPPDATEAPPLEFDKKYSDAQKTPLRKEVVASPKAGDYDLKLTK